MIIRIKRDFEMQRIEHYIKGERRKKKKKWKRNGVSGESFLGATVAGLIRSTMYILRTIGGSRWTEC